MSDRLAASIQADRHARGIHGATWTIEDRGARPLTLNRVMGLHRMQWATHTRVARLRWWALAVQAHIPQLERISVDVTPLHKDGRSPQDPVACAAEFKAALDGLVDARVIPGDHGAHVVCVTFWPPDICGHEGMRLTITNRPGGPT